MIISRTPFRISFFGGGTDYPKWYLKQGGMVLSTTIDKYCYLSCRYYPPFFSNKHRIVWSHIEAVSSLSEILHPAIREGLRYLGFDDSVGVEIHYQGDLPARAGMGSSSTFSVGMIKALLALRGQMIGKHELALKAIELEQSILKETVGCQDQVAAAYGGLNVIRFLQNGSIQVEPVVIPSTRLLEFQSHLMLCYPGTSRFSFEIAEKIVDKLEAKQQILHQMQEMVEEALSILNSQQSLDQVGHLLHQAWLLKRSLTPEVTSPLIDQIYEIALQHGALGGKLLGAGGTGFMVFYVPLEKQAAVKGALSQLLWIPFAFEREGSTLIYYDEPMGG